MRIFSFRSFEMLILTAVVKCLKMTVEECSYYYVSLLCFPYHKNEIQMYHRSALLKSVKIMICKPYTIFLFPSFGVRVTA